MNARLIKYAAAVVVIGVVGLFAWLTSGNGMASVVFAEVVRQINEAETLTFTTISQTEGEEPATAQCMYMEPGRVRISSNRNIVLPAPLPEGSVWIMDFRKGVLLILDPIKKTGTKLETDTSAAPTPNMVRLMKNLPSKAERKLGVREIDGRKAIGFVVRKFDEKITFGQEYVVWVDQQSALPIRVEMEISDRKGRKGRITVTDIQFDRKLDESLFSLELPVGYTIDESAMLKLERSRQMARRAVSAANMHKLVTGCLEYSKDHNGQWPGSLEELVGMYGITEKHLVNPSQKQRRIGYVYLKPAGASLESGQLLMYEAHDEWKDGINVGFADRYVKFIADEEEFKRLLEKAQLKEGSGGGN